MPKEIIIRRRGELFEIHGDPISIPDNVHWYRPAPNLIEITDEDDILIRQIEIPPGYAAFVRDDPSDDVWNEHTFGGESAGPAASAE